MIMTIEIKKILKSIQQEVEKEIKNQEFWQRTGNDLIHAMSLGRVQSLSNVHSQLSNVLLKNMEYHVANDLISYGGYNVDENDQPIVEKKTGFQPIFVGTSLDKE